VPVPHGTATQIINAVSIDAVPHSEPHLDETNVGVQRSFFEEGHNTSGGKRMLFDLSVPWWELVLSGGAVYAATLGILRLT
jgi:hypothetical protein